MKLAVEILILPWLVTGVVVLSALLASAASRRCRQAFSIAIWGE